MFSPTVNPPAPPTSLLTTPNDIEILNANEKDTTFPVQWPLQQCNPIYHGDKQATDRTRPPYWSPGNNGWYIPWIHIHLFKTTVNLKCCSPGAMFISQD